MSAGGLPGARPERLSEQAKLTETGELFHPFTLGAGERDPTIVGGVLSNLIVRVFVDFRESFRETR